MKSYTITVNGTSYEVTVEEHGAAEAPAARTQSVKALVWDADAKKVVKTVSVNFGKELPDWGQIHTIFDDSIIADAAAEKAQDMAEVGVTMHAWEYRMKWYGEDEKTARKRAEGLSAAPEGAKAARGRDGMPRA